MAPSFLTVSAEQRHYINDTMSEDHLHSTWWRDTPRHGSHTSNIVDWLRLWRYHPDILIQKDASEVYYQARS